MQFYKRIPALLALAAILLLPACAKHNAPPPPDDPPLVIDDETEEPTAGRISDPSDELVSEEPTEEPTQTTSETETQTTTETATEETDTGESETQSAFVPEDDESQESEAATVNEIEESTAPAPAGTAATETGNAIARLALDLIGSPFEYGTQGPETFDNSGFVYYCCQENGVRIPRRTSEFAAAGTEITYEELQPGDIVIFSTEIGGNPDFAGIYVGNGQFVSCNTTESPTGVHSMTSGHWAERFICGRRVG